MVDLNEISPYIRVAMDSVIRPPWKLAERVIFDYELLYVMEGQVDITIEEEHFRAAPGEVFLFKPGQRHSLEIKGDGPFHQPHIHFDFFYREDSPSVKVSFKALERMTREEASHIREDVTKDTVLALPNKLPVRNIGYFENMLLEIIKEYEERTPFFEIQVKGLFMKLLAYLLREYGSVRNPAADSRLEELKLVREYLKRNTQRDVTLDELDSEFKISKYLLSRLFKRAFGITPIRYAQLMKMERARELIQYGSQNLTSIAEMLGFSSINAFSRAFKEMEGVPPSYYKSREIDNAKRRGM